MPGSLPPEAGPPRPPRAPLARASPPPGSLPAGWAAPGSQSLGRPPSLLDPCRAPRGTYTGARASRGRGGRGPGRDPPRATGPETPSYALTIPAAVTLPPRGPPPLPGRPSPCPRPVPPSPETWRRRRAPGCARPRAAPAACCHGNRAAAAGPGCGGSTASPSRRGPSVRARSAWPARVSAAAAPARGASGLVEKFWKSSRSLQGIMTNAVRSSHGSFKVCAHSAC